MLLGQVHIDKARCNHLNLGPLHIGAKFGVVAFGLRNCRNEGKNLGSPGEGCTGSAAPRPPNDSCYTWLSCFFSRAMPQIWVLPPGADDWLHFATHGMALRCLRDDHGVSLYPAAISRAAQAHAILNGFSFRDADPLAAPSGPSSNGISGTDSCHSCPKQIPPLPKPWLCSSPAPASSPAHVGALMCRPHAEPPIPSGAKVGVDLGGTGAGSPDSL